MKIAALAAVLCAAAPAAGSEARAGRAQDVKPAPRHAPAPASEWSAWDEHLRDAATMYALPFALVKAVAAAESAFDPKAVSRAGARGMMQLMPGTARQVYVNDPHDPLDAIYGGARYLRQLANEFEGDFIKVVAAYNAGPEAVRKAGGIPNIAETRAYVRRVTGFYEQFRKQEEKARASR